MALGAACRNPDCGKVNRAAGKPPLDLWPVAGLV